MYVVSHHSNVMKFYMIISNPMKYAGVAAILLCTVYHYATQKGQFKTPKSFLLASLSIGLAIWLSFS